MADVWAVGGEPPEPIGVIAEAIGSTDLATSALMALGVAGYRLVWDAPWVRAGEQSDGTMRGGTPQ